MAIVTTDDKHYKDIADAIRHTSDVSGGIKPENMSGHIVNIARFNFEMGEAEGYTEGKADGYSEGLTKGEADGAKAEYDRFWDAFQNNGNRTDYQFGFAGAGWWRGSFKPKYDINVTRADYMFATWTDVGQNKFDLTAALEESGVKLDTSKCTNFSYFMRYQSPGRVPEIDTRSASSLANMFNNASIVTIDKLILKDDGSQTLNNAIYICAGLENLTIEGVIGYNGFSLQWSTKLSKESIISVINALSTTTSGYTVTLSKTALTNAFGSSTSEEWQALRATRPNWTISTV